MPAQSLLTIKDAASSLGVTTKTLRRWEKVGQIVSHRTFGGHRRYSASDLEKFRNDSYPFGNIKIPAQEPIRIINIAPVYEESSQDNFLFNVALMSFILISSVLIVKTTPSPPSSTAMPRVLGLSIGEGIKNPLSSIRDYFGSLSGSEALLYNGNIEVTGKVVLAEANVTDSLAVNGNVIIGSSGKIPSLTNLFFESLDGSELTNVTATSLSGFDTSDFLKTDTSVFTSAVTFSANPESGEVSAGPVYINPAVVPGDYTLLGASNNGTAKFRVDAEGDTFFGGDIQVQGGDITSGSLTFNLLNTSVTTLNIGGVATAVNIGVSGGTLTINSSTLSVPNLTTLTLTNTGTLNCNDCIDFDDLADTLTMDVATTITNGTVGNFTVTLSSTGDFIVEDATNDTSPFTITDAGLVGIGTTAPSSPLNIIGGSGEIVLQDSATNNSNKVGSIRLAHRTSDTEEAINLIAGQSQSATTTLFLGGGVANLNAATLIRIFTATDTTTLTGTERIRIDSNGFVSVGHTTPVNPFSVGSANIATSGIALAIFDQDESQDIITASMSATPKFRVDQNGRIYGDLQVASTTGVCWQTISYNGTNNFEEFTDCSSAPGDLAENFGTSDPNIEAGDLVVSYGEAEEIVVNGMKTSKAYIQKSSRQYEQSIVGVVSTQPNEVYAEDGVFNAGDNPKPVSLAGRVPTKVSTENGPVAVGDPLTSSSTPGVAMKAAKAGPTLGKALQSYDDPDPDQIGKIIVFVNVSWYDPAFALNENGDVLGTNTESTSGDETVQINNETDSQLLSEIENLSASLENLETEVSLLKSSILTDSTPASLGDSPTLTSLNVLGSSILGETLINGKLAVGILSFDNLLGSVDAIGPLKLQSLALDSVFISGDSVEIDKNGDLSLRKGALRGNDTIRGAVEVDKNQTSANVEVAWEETPVSILVTPTFQTQVWVTDTSEQGFTIEVSDPPTQPEKIYWWAIW